MIHDAGQLHIELTEHLISETVFELMEVVSPLLGPTKPMAQPFRLAASERDPARTAASVAGLLISLLQLSPKNVDRLSDGRGTLQCRFLENASSSLFILFGP